jgi:vacuolar-type H+-ATPase subunit H
MLIKLQADVSQLKTGLAQAESAIKGVDKSVQTASSGMANFATKVKQIGASIGIAFAGTQVLQFGRDVITQAMEAEAQQQRLYQLMKVGTGATDEQVAALNAQAEALEKVGVVTGGNITQTQSQLATFNLQAETIERLTPAILDYVTAEKGANASADEFKQMTNGLAQALNGNFGSLTRVGFVLDDHTKKLISSGTEAEKSAAIVDVLNSTYKDFNKELRNTPEGQMQALRNDFDALKTDLGKKLLPALLAVTGFLTKTFIPALRSLGKFLKDNGDAIKIYVGIIGTLVIALYTYKAALVTVKVAQQLYVVAMTLMKGATLASIASTNGLAASMLVLNAAMRANPIGLIITALALVGAAFVFAWKKSETFRGIVIKGVQIVLTGFAYLVQGIGKFIGMLSKVPGMGWAKGIADGAQKASDSIKATSKNLSDLKGSVKSGYGEGAFTYGSGSGKGTGGGGGGGGGGLDDKEKKKLEGLKKDVTKIYKDMNEAIADAQEKAQEVLDRRNEVMFKAHKDYDEKVAELNKRFKEANEEADKRFAEAKADAQKRRDKAETEAYKRNKETLEGIEKDYAEKKADLLKSNNDKLDDIRKKAADKTADLTKAAAEKQANIVQQGVDRLRNAFASKTGFDLGEAFKSGADSADKLLADLKTKLTAVKELQANAAKLAGMGYSQVFIEEVVKQGPEAGNKIAEALKAASPEATLELQELYFGLEDVSKNGLNALAKQMSTSTSFATEEMMNAYNQVSIDLKESLAEVNAQMNEALAESNKAYAEAIAKAEKDRTEKIASANKALTEALAESKVAYDEALADATKALTEARERAQKDLSEGLAEAQKTLQEALLEAQKDYEKAIDEINKSTNKKLEDLKAKLKEVAALMAALSAASAAAAVANAPKFTPIIASSAPGGSGGGATSVVTNYNTSITGVNLSDPTTTTNQVVNGIKFGNVIVPSAPSALAAGESGAIGAMSISSRITPVLTSAEIVANRRKAQGGYL